MWAEILREMGANFDFMTLPPHATLTQLLTLLSLECLVYRMFLTLKIIKMHEHKNTFKISPELCFRQADIHITM